MVQKPFPIIVQHITERIWVCVCDFICTHSIGSVSTQCVFIALLAMDLGVHILKSNIKIKIDPRERINWLFGLKIFYSKFQGYVWKWYEVFSYTILDVFPKLKYLKCIWLRSQDHHRPSEHAPIYKLSIYKMFVFIFSMNHKEMSCWQLFFTPHYQLTLASGMSVVCSEKK